MLLQQMFIENAKQNLQKIAIHDKATGKDLPYARMLIGALILSEKFKKYKGEHIGIMVPTSAGAHLSVLGALMSGKVPVMINYSTGALDNCEYAQEKCSFRTIITSKKLLTKAAIVPPIDFLSTQGLKGFPPNLDSPTKDAKGSDMVINNIPMISAAGLVFQNNSTRIKNESGKYTVP